MHEYTLEELKYLRTHAAGRGNKEITQMFNSHFKLDIPLESIKAAKKNHKISSGLDGRFTKGHVPVNKGKKGVSYPGMIATQFKPGHMPVNHRCVGSERISVDGYTEIKTAEPKKWRMKHVVVWEEANGPVPKNHVVIFADGNKQNLVIENLLLIQRRKLLVANKRGLIHQDAELTKIGLIIADVHIKCADRKRKNKERRT